MQLGTTKLRTLSPAASSAAREAGEATTCEPSEGPQLGVTSVWYFVAVAGRRYTYR